MALLHACSDHGDAKHRRVQSPLQHALSSVHSHTHVEHVEFWPSRPSRIECGDGSQRHAVTRGSPNRLVRIPPRAPAARHDCTRTVGQPVTRHRGLNKHGMGGWVPTERGATPRSRPKTHSGPRRSVIRARPGSGSSPTPVTAWLPSASMAAPKGGGGSAALCLPSASPLSDARCRSHETRLCAPGRTSSRLLRPRRRQASPSSEPAPTRTLHGAQSHSCRTCRILAQ